MKFFPFEDWLPDQPDTDNPGMVEARNVIPSQIGYRPFPQQASISDALSEDALGAVTLKDNDNNVWTFAGTETTLQRLTTQTWNDLSKAGGYATGSGERWEFTLYGDRVIATNYSDEIQTFNVNSDTDYSDLSADAPRGRRLGIINEFVFLGDINDATDGVVRNRVQWSAIGDPTDWPTPGTQDAATKQSDFQDLPIGGPVMGIARAAGGSDGIILCQRAVYRVSYQGPPTVFGFYPIEEDRGCVAAGSVVSTGSRAYFLAEDGFYVTDGSGVQSIGEGKVDRWFYENVNRDRLFEITSAVDPFNRLVIWLFPTTGNDGAPDRALVYHWPTQRWSYADLTARLIFQDYVQGYTLDELDNVSASIDALEFSLDSRAWTGGRLVLSAINGDDEVTRLEGLPMEARLTTAEFNGDGQGGRIFVSGLIPLVDGAEPLARVLYRQTVWGGPLSQSDERAPDDNRTIHFRVDARYARARIRIPAGGDWTHATGVHMDIKAAGMR